MQDATTRAMAANAITMIAAEYTETGWAAEGLRERIASIATLADIRHDELRLLLIGGWEEGAICLLADAGDGSADLAQLLPAAQYLGLTFEEISDTTAGRRLRELGVLHADAMAIDGRAADVAG